jgi:hypothetical protein
MKVFWDDCGEGLSAEEAKQVDLNEARLIWSDTVRGVEGNFLGLTDEQEKTVQFYYVSDIPDDVEDARHLAIVLVDFPVADRQGSYQRQVTIGEVDGLIVIAFQHGAVPRPFGTFDFVPWP